MAARAGDRLAARQAEEGMRRIPLAAGLEALGRLMVHPSPQVAVLDVDWERLVATVHRGARPPTLSRLVADAPVARGATPAAGAVPQLLAAIAGVPRAEWDAKIEAAVEAAAARILRLPPGRPIERGTPLLELGLDSLLAVELKNAIADAGVDIAVARVMTGPSVRQIAQMVLTVLDERGPRPVAAAPGAEIAHPAPPIDPLVSHAVAFFLGIAFVVLAYVSRGIWAKQQEIPPDDAAIEAPAPGPVAPAAPPGKRGKKAR
jgi:hypothetical protein